MLRHILTLLVVCIASVAFAITTPFNITVSIGTPFTALHTYYMAATGCNDGNNGTSPATPWCTPNHAVVCGDVILAAPGSYTGGFMSWGTVSTCPSTTGGIDGTGGIYFATLLCGGADLEACQLGSITTTDAMGVNASNWAVEGWKMTGGSKDGFIIETGSTTTQIHHVAAINNIGYNEQMGFQANDNGANHNIPGNGADYFAWVGNIAADAGRSGFGVAGINIIGLSTWDTVAGTHALAYGNFSYNLTSTSSADGEAYMLDSPGAHGYAQQIVFANNIGFASRAYCLILTDHNINISSPTVKIHNMTCYGNLVNVNSIGTNVGEMEFNFASDQAASVITLTNNIFQSNQATNSGTNVYAGTIGGTHLTALTDTGNFWYGIATVCGSGTCMPTSSPYSVVYFNSNTSSGTDTYGISAAFTNVADLLANRVGTPTCTGFVTTTACMGWNANTSTLTTPSVISDLVPTATGTAGKGYQLPSTTCAANADYPAWLKGIVYLHWDGTSITQVHDLVTTPCGL